MTVRIAIADDDQLVRAGIAGLLEHHEDLHVTVQCGDGAELVRELLVRPVDVALIDIQMPRLDGLDALSEMHRAGIRTPTAMLTTFRHDHLIEGALRRGARGFLLKSDPPDDLARNVRALADGEAVFSPRVARWLIEHGTVERLRGRESARQLVDRLTTRQRELLSLLATGASNQQIAAQLHLSEGTVKQYLRAIYEQIGVENRVQAALIGYQAELAEPSP